MITERTPTEKERAQILTGSGCLGCLIPVCTIIAVVPPLLGMMGGSLGLWIGLAIGLALGGGLFALFLPVHLDGRRWAAEDVQRVQEIEVINPRLFEIDLISDNEPILVFDIGDGKLLFLQGQWLREPDTYIESADANNRMDDGETEHWSQIVLNGLPPPNSFPSNHFTLVRRPHSGKVLRITVHGKYIRPEKTVEALRPEFDFGDSEVFDGPLENIADVLVREHWSRKSARARKSK